MEANKFLKIPVPILAEAFTDPTNFYDTIFSVGVYAAAESSNVTTNACISQCLYAYCFTKDLPSEINEAIQEMIDEKFLFFEQIQSWLDDDGNFHPDLEVLDMVYDSLNNEVFWPYNSFALMLPDFRRFGKIKITLHHLGIAANASAIYECYDEMQKKYGKLFDAPFAPVPIDKCFELSENWQNFDQSDFAIFAAYCATLSIIGNKPFAVTTTDAILSRMVGAASKDELVNLLATNQRLELVHKCWSARRKTDFLLSELEERYGLQRVSINRGLAISYALEKGQLEQRVRARIDC